MRSTYVLYRCINTREHTNITTGDYCTYLGMFNLKQRKETKKSWMSSASQCQIPDL